MNAVQRKVKKQDLIRQLCRLEIAKSPRKYRAIQKKADALLRAEVLIAESEAHGTRAE